MREVEKGSGKMEKVIGFLKNEEGVSAIEYGLMAALIAVALVIGATALGGKLDACFTYVANKVKSAPAD